jgi:hypothetical protein
MVLDYEADAEFAGRHSVFDAVSGECLDKTSPWFYADDESGILRRRLRDENGKRYVWDRRTRQRLHPPIVGVPSEDIEVAWEEVRRAIVIKPKVVEP